MRRSLTRSRRNSPLHTPHGHVWANRCVLRSRSSLLRPNHLLGTPPFRPSNPCYSATFCHFDIPNFAWHRFYPLIVNHPAPTTAFSGRSIISSSANAEGTTVGPICREFDMPINDKVKATRRKHAVYRLCLIVQLVSSGLLLLANRTPLNLTSSAFELHEYTILRNHSFVGNLDLSKIIKSQWPVPPTLPPLAGSPAFLHTNGTYRSNLLHLPAALIFPLGSYIIGGGKFIIMTGRNGKASKQSKPGEPGRFVAPNRHRGKPLLGTYRPTSTDINVGLSGQNRLNAGRTRDALSLLVTYTMV